ncbi:MAG: hypothetical protein Kow00108_13940 [Calditrichia bacterium]
MSERNKQKEFILELAVDLLRDYVSNHPVPGKEGQDKSPFQVAELLGKMVVRMAEEMENYLKS